MWIGKKELRELQKIKQDVVFEQQRKSALANIHLWRVTTKDGREFGIRGYYRCGYAEFYDEHGLVAEFNEVLSIERAGL